MVVSGKAYGNGKAGGNGKPNMFVAPSSFGSGVRVASRLSGVSLAVELRVPLA